MAYPSSVTQKKALITGITGQDGSYLAEFLLAKGYEVYGIVRRSSLLNRERIDHLVNKYNENGKNKLYLVYGDLGDSNSIYRIVKQVVPDEVYHLGAQSHVRVSFDIPEYTGDITGLGTIRILEAIRDICPKAKFYQASSSEIFGKVEEIPQKETTPFHPRSPYGCAKVFGYWVAKNYRESYNMFVCNGILFNHESPRRGMNFVTRKITRAVADIKYGRQKYLYLGNLEAKRDWGYAPEFIEIMWLIMQQKEPDDYVIATGETHSIREFLQEAFSYGGLGDYRQYVRTDEKYYRPAEVDILIGDASKAKKKLEWNPKTTFKQIVHLMVDADVEMVKNEIEGSKNKYIDNPFHF